jgi:hypothetical protein
MTVAVTAFAGGCSVSSLDSDVFVLVDHAVLDVDTQQPGALAQIDVSVTFDAQRSATRELELRGASLIAGGQSIPLTLTVPDGFDMNFEPNERRTAQLVNAGVTNASLMGACGQDWQISVTVAGANGRDQDADDDANDEPFDEHRAFDYGYVPAVLNCQP